MEQQKPVFYTELAYVIGLILLAFATAFMTVGGFGQSMVAAPSYLLHLKISQYLPFFSFGMANYTFQAFLLLVMIAVVRRFRLSYLFSFVTGVLYGLCLDGAMLVVTLIPSSHVAVRIALYILGILCCSIAVSLMFRTYISPAVYELFVKEIAEKFHIPTARFKTAYDCVNCVLSIILSFCFFGWLHFEGIGVGTILCALVNGPLIGLIGKFLDKTFHFKDAAKLRF